MTEVSLLAAVQSTGSRVGNGLLVLAIGLALTYVNFRSQAFQRFRRRAVTVFLGERAGSVVDTVNRIFLALVGAAFIVLGLLALLDRLPAI